MIEKGLNQHNFIPGTERYTRPEEVKALNKFLKSIKETQEEHTKISEDNLALPKDGPKIPDVELQDKRVNVSGVLSQVDRLVEGRLNIENNNPGNLDNSKINLEGEDKINSLSEVKERINPGVDRDLESSKIEISGKEQTDLETEKLGLSENQVKSLEESRINIENTKKTTLPNNPDNLPMSGEGLQKGDVSDLSSERKTISGSKDVNLEKSKLGIKNENKVSLGDKNLKITDTHKNSLESEVLKIRDNQKQTKLENTKEKIQNSNKNSLETERLEISDAHKNSLEDNLEKITPGENQNLETGKLEIQENKINSLETKSQEIQDSNINSLETRKLDIQENKVNSLDSYKETIQENQEKELSNIKLDIQENKINSLDSHQETIQGNQGKELSDTKLNIQENSVSDLESNLERISPEEQKSLETTKLEILENQEGKLEDGRLDIQENKVNSLDSYKETIQENQEKELSNIKLDIQENKINSLDSHQETIQGNQGKELSDTKLNIQENSVSDLENTRENIYPENDRDLESTITNLQVDPTINSLSEEVIEGPTKNNPDSLEDEIIDLKVDSGVSLLSNSRIDINPAQENTLSETKEEISIEEKISDLDYSQEGLGIEGVIDSLSEVLIEGPEVNEKDLNTTSIPLDKGEEKINSLDTTIINGPETNNPKSLEDSLISLRGPEDQELETSREKLEIGENQNSLEDFIDTLGTPEDKPLDETRITLDSSSEVRILEDEIITRPGNADLQGRTYSDGSYSLSSAEIKDTQIELKDNRRPLEELEDEKLILSGVENYEKDQENSNFYDELPEDKIDGVQDPGIDGRTIYDSSKYKLSKVELKYDSVELNRENQEDPNLIEDSVELSFGAGYSYTNRTISDPQKYDILEVENEEALKEYGEELSMAITRPNGHTLSNRTITDLDLTVKDPDYVMSMIKSVSERGDKASILIPENSIENRTSNNESYSVTEIEEKKDLESYQEKSKDLRPENAGLEGRTISDLGKTSSDPEYAVKNASKVSSRDDKSGTSVPKNQSSKEITSINGIGELHTQDKYRHGQSGDHGYLTPGYKLPEIGWKNFWDGGALSPSTYLRWATENTVGKIPLKGAMKGKLIDETLALLVIAREKLEKVTKGNRERLPGGDLGLLSDLASGKLSVKSAAKSVVGAVGKALSTSTVDKSQPINRPDLKEAKLSSYWEAPGQDVLDSSKKISGKTSGFFNKVGTSLFGGDSFSTGGIRLFKDMIDPSFIGIDSNYSFTGIGATMSMLINHKKLTHYSLTEFKDALKQSRYITTPDKFTSTSDSTNYMTLDSNHIWEIIFKPYLGKLNGYKTWLPSFYEIDKQNKYSFNMTTHHASGWLPITGFELQDKKLTSKDLPLFNGSISYPIGLEFTNELRLTFADDSLKSLKRYFDLCTKVSAYMSNIHTEGEPGYLLPEDDLSVDVDNPTVYIDGKVHPGLYKNLSFIVTIFILTPQYGTIKQCNLLCVIKDYSLDNQGETDSSPTELNVTFSIVGENPLDISEMKEQAETKSYTPPKKTGQTDRLGTGILDNLGSVVNIF